MLGWTRKPIAAWWPHPLFTVSGIARFWGAVMTTFWRGEHVWHLEPLRTEASDLLFVTTSGVAAVGGVVLACRRRIDPPERLTAAMGLLGLAASLALLAYVSLAFDFGSCPYPSRESPFLMAGRLMIGMAAPFVILLVRSVSRALGALRIPGLAIPLLLTLCITLAASELWGTGPVFASSYNWFHLGG
jgi:hypothetical protein